MPFLVQDPSFKRQPLGIILEWSEPILIITHHSSLRNFELIFDSLKVYKLSHMTGASNMRCGQATMRNPCLAISGVDTSLWTWMSAASSGASDGGAVANVNKKALPPCPFTS